MAATVSSSIVGRNSIVCFHVDVEKHYLYFPVLFLEIKIIKNGKGNKAWELFFDKKPYPIEKVRAQRLWRYLVRDGWRPIKG